MGELEERFEQLRRDSQKDPPFERTYAFLAFHLEWAEVLKETDPIVAIRQFACAEDCQRTIGTFATGSGEGLASMGALYEIMGKRADLTEGLGDSAADAGTALRHLNGALEIWSTVQSDPNGLGGDTPAAPRIALLQAKIAARKSSR